MRETARSRLKPIAVITIAIIVAIALCSGTASAASSPGKVKGVTAKASGKSVTVKWNKVSGANGYQLYMDGVKEKTFTKGKTVSGKITNVSPGEHFFKVRAYKSEKQYYHKKQKKWVTKKPAAKYIKKTRTKNYYGKFSAVKKATVAGDDGSEETAAPTITSPATPTNFKAVSGEGCVKLYWTAKATAYEVYRNETGQFTDDDTPAAYVTSPQYCDTNAKAGKTYYYRVAGYNTAGNQVAFSDYSAVVSGTPSASDASSLPPGVSMNKSGIKIVIREQDLTAQELKNFFASVGEKYESTDKVTYQTVVNRDNNSRWVGADRTFTDNEVKKGTTYTYDVTCILRKTNKSGEEFGAQLNKTSFTVTYSEQYFTSDAGAPFENSFASQPPLSPPTGLTAKGDKNGVTLTWEKQKRFAKSYVVYRGNTVIGETEELNFTDNQFRYGKTYSFGVASKDQYGNVSAKSTVSMNVPVPTITHDKKFVAHPEITMDYLGTKIYLGQDWSNSLYNALKKGSSGEYKVVRKDIDMLYKSVSETPNGGNVLDDYEVDKLDQTLYLFDTGDYSDFLIVYVSETGQIVKWMRNNGEFGKDGSEVFNFGDVIYPGYVSPEYSNYANGDVYVGNKYGCWLNYREPSWNDEDYQNGAVRPDYPDGAVIIGGYALKSEDGYYRSMTTNMEDLPTRPEKMIMLHITNALRYDVGADPLTYNEDLDGTGKTFTGTLGKTTFTNQIYGAQPWAETMYANQWTGHEDIDVKPDGTTFTEGILGSKNGGRGDALKCMRAIVYYNQKLRHIGENVGGSWGTGEVAICNYYHSRLHYHWMIDKNIVCVGIGMHRGYHCEEYAENR